MSGKQNGRNRRNFIRTGLFVGAGAVGLPVLHAPGQSGCPPATDVAAFELDEITISQLADGMSFRKVHCPRHCGKVSRQNRGH